MTDAEKILIFDQWIAEADSIVISTHTHPDGDAVGSACALADYLKNRGKAVDVVLPGPVPESLLFALDSGTAELVHSEAEKCLDLISAADLLVSIDYNRPDRAAGLSTAIQSSEARKVLIDHHLYPAAEFYGLVFSTPESSSSCEVLYNILKAMPGTDNDVRRIGQNACRLLMLGMTTDTNNFANSTYPSTLSMAGELLAAGVDRQAILSGLYNSYRENRFRFMGYFLSDKLEITEYGLAYAVLSESELQRFGILEGETEGFVNIPLGIASVKMSILLKQDGNTLRVSIRSKQGISANKCATMYFHGGGHENASGGRLDMPQDVLSVSEAGDYIEKYCGEFFSNEALWRSEN